MDIKSLIFGKQLAQTGINQYSNSTQKWLPVADIQGGMVRTKDGRYVKILEVLPVNFYLKSPIEQQNIIYYFSSYLKIAPNNLQILTITQKADIEGYTERLWRLHEIEPSEQCREMIADNIEEVAYLAANEAVAHRFFIAFEYESGMKARGTSDEGISNCLRDEEQTARRYLDMCGLEVIYPNFADNFQLELLYSLINKRSSIHQKLDKAVFDMATQICGGDDNFAERMEDLQNEEAEISEEQAVPDTAQEQPMPFEKQWQAESITQLPSKKTKLGRTKSPKIKSAKKFFEHKKKLPELSPIESGTISIPDILAPSSADFTNRDFVGVDGVYHSYLYITGYGYPTTVGNGWLNPLVEAGEGINVSFTIHRQAKDKVLSKISKTTMLNRARMRDVDDTRQDFEELDSAINSGLFLKNEMNRNSEDFYYMHTIIEVSAEDFETLQRRISGVETLCTSQGFLAKRCDYKQPEAFLSCLPLLALDEDIERKSRRNILTRDVAAAFPFSSFEICDQSGIMLGINLHNRSVCMLDIFDSSKYANANMSILGMSGAGKTFLLQLIAMRLRQQNIQVFIIAPLKGYEFRPACEAMGGLYVKLSPSSNDCINIMEIRRATLDTDAALSNHTDRGDSLLADKIAKLHIFFSLLRSNISEEESHYLDSALVECYRRFGINHANTSLYNEAGEFKPMPILKDLHDVLSEKNETKMLALALSRFVTGSASRLGQHTNIDLNNKYIVLDISEYG